MTDHITARDLLLEQVTPVGTETVSLPLCGGRVLARDLTAKENIPAFDRSPYDGYAFRAQDTLDASREHPVTLRILEEIPAGSVPTKTITEGTAAKILTGAPIPPGADAVCMYEKTEFTPDSVTVFSAFKTGENVIYTGEDQKAGTLLARAGDLIDTGIAGTLASQGDCAPEVYRIPRIGLISTGSEVVDADTAPAPGQIRDSNRHMLEAFLRREGLEPVWLGHARDDTDSITALIMEGARTCDAVLLTGGVSAGDYDLTADAMERAGCRILLRGVQLKPGMACVYSVLDGKLICGLSGNPASSLTNLIMVALPALRRLAGRRECIPEMFPIRLKTAFRKKSGMTRVLRGRLDLTDGTAGLILTGGQGNVVLSGTIGCNAMAVVPGGSGPLDAGTELKGFVL